jgi:hypothetical protein
VYGLKTGHEANGLIGVLGAFDPVSGLYDVSMRDGTIQRFRRGNLLQMLMITFTVEAIALVRRTWDPDEHPEDHLGRVHAGTKGLLFEYNERSHIYGVELESGDAIPVPVGHVRVPRGTVGTVVGVPQYNGVLARVLSHDDDTASYLVAIGNTRIRLRRCNLRV